jgi:hypothetical protein
MVEPMQGIRDGEGRQRLRNCLLKGLAGPRLGRAEGGLELRTAGLNRRQIRRIWRQVQEPRASLVAGFTETLYFLRPLVVHDHNVPCAQRGAEHLLDIDGKYLDIGGAVDRHHRLNPGVPRGRQHRHVRSITVGEGTNDPLSLRSTTIPEGHREVDARCTDELKALGIKHRDSLLIDRLPLLDARGAPFTGLERLFCAATPE